MRKSLLSSSSSPKRSYFLFISSSCFFILSLDLSWLAKRALPSLTPISSHRLVRALNSRMESLLEDSTSTVKFLHNSLKKFFTKASFPAKNSRSAARKGDETNRWILIKKTWWKALWGSTSCQQFQAEFFHQARKDDPLCREVCHLCSKTW